MKDLSSLDQEQLLRRISRDLADGYDEELEMEIEDHHPLPGKPVVADEESKDYRRYYFQQLFQLQTELIKLQDWVVANREHVVILFEGRDAAGKGGVIKRISQRPWYNRAGVERVMGFCTPAEYEEFFRSVPEFERMLVRSGIRLLKYWFSITDEYTKAKEVMLRRSHIPEARWWVVHAVDKKRARLNCIDHLLKQFPYTPVHKDAVVLPEREHHEHYSRQAVPAEMLVPEVY